MKLEKAKINHFGKVSYHWSSQHYDTRGGHVDVCVRTAHVRTDRHIGILSRLTNLTSAPYPRNGRKST